MRGRLEIVGLMTLVFAVAACASGKEERREEPAEQPQAAPPAEGQPEPEAQSPQAGQLPAQPGEARTARATRQVAVIDAGLVAAAANARALQTLASDPASYDPEEGELLLDNARDALSNTRRQLDGLASAARGTEHRAAVDELDRRVSAAEDSFDRIADSLELPIRVAEAASRAYADLAAAVQPLRNVARAMNTGVEVVGPTG